MKHKYNAYTAATQTVAKTRQIVLLYDGAIRFMQQAKEAIRAQRIEERYHLLIRASDIVSGLQSCIDFERGGNVAKALYHYYALLDQRIFSIHHTSSLETCDEVIADLKQMRDVWEEIDQKGMDPEPESDGKPAASSDDTAPSSASKDASGDAAPVTFSA